MNWNDVQCLEKMVPEAKIVLIEQADYYLKNIK
jgi:hypothetical protein